MDRKERRERHRKKQIPGGVEKYQWVSRFTDEEVDEILYILEKYAAYSSPDHIEKNDAFNMLCEKGLTKDEAKFELETAR